MHEGVDVDGNPAARDLDQAEAIYNQVLNHNVGNALVLYCLGSLHMERGNMGLAVMMLGQVAQISPTMPEAWNNLGLAWRGLQKKDQAAQCFASAVKNVPADKPHIKADILSNMAGMHINEGSPADGLNYANQSLVLAPGDKKS